MTNKAIGVSLVNSEFASTILIDKIVRLSKSEDGEITYIHLTTGEILALDDSIRTLEARMNR